MTWYVYGEYALDRLLNVRRAEVVQVYAPDGLLTPRELRGALDVNPQLAVEVSDRPPRQLITLDRYVVEPNGEIYDIRAESREKPTTFDARLVEFDLTAEDVIRLARIRNAYPELIFDSLLTARLQVDLMHLESLRSQFPDLEIRFASLEPFSRWRL